MRKNILFITSCLLAATTFAEDINTLPKDTTKVIDIEEVVVIASPKETGKLRELPTASRQDVMNKMFFLIFIVWFYLIHHG